MGEDVLIVLNAPPYETEKAYNGLRLAIALQARNYKVNVFVMADVVFCGVPKQETPTGYYNINEVLGESWRRMDEW